MIEISLHPASFKAKPDSEAASKISNEIGKHKNKCSLSKFKHSLEAGQCWCPGIFTNNKRNKNNWLRQSVFAADIDLGNRELAELLAICELHCLEPLILHESFSSCPQNKKWRVIFKTEEPITDLLIAEAIQRKLAELFDGDTSIADGSRMLYGTNKPVAYFDEDAVLDLFELGELSIAQDRPSTVNSKVLQQVTDDFISDQFAIFKILSKKEQGRLSLIETRLKEAHECIKTIGQGSGYMSVLSSTAKLAQLRELLAPYISYFITDCVDNCDEYAHGVWQHRPRLSELIEAGIKLGRNRLYD